MNESILSFIQRVGIQERKVFQVSPQEEEFFEAFLCAQRTSLPNYATRVIFI
jgi:hypothetical protein